MKTYIFPVGGSFGKGDSWDGEYEIALTNKEAKLLEESAKEYNDGFAWLSDDPILKDIAWKVEHEAYKQDYRQLLADKDFVREQREWYEDHNPKGHADSTIVKWYLDQTSFHAGYPKELDKVEE